eukprot:gb/GEZN01005071.1/.p1 GENE.gb/GEZN01005071.1/~~gb/GEZN01005071.1/.p1  ORF type:complete len:520 (+),score=29.64 gb/GEZN01005071.1/:181-1560(+)
MSYQQQDTWTCVRCTFAGNHAGVETCDVCSTVRPLQVYGGESSSPWACTVCTFIQTGPHDRCEMCNSPRSDRPRVTQEEQTTADDTRIDISSVMEDPLIGPPIPNFKPSLIRQGSDLIDKVPKFLKQISQQKEFFCGICMNNVAETEKTSLCCPHEYCKECMEDYVSLEIKEARVLNITCPGLTKGKKCDAPFSAKDIKEIVKDKNILEKYERFIKIKTNSNFIECPDCHHLQKGNRRSPVMHCERKECNKEFCFFHSAAHPGISCYEYKRKNKKQFAEDREYLDKNSIYCPNRFCRTPIFKHSGCNHMTCSRCAAEFCYLCGGMYMFGLHFHEYNCLGCPDQQSSGGGPNSNRSWKRCVKELFGWPLMLILCSCPLAFVFAIFLCFEACWAACFALCLPCLAGFSCNLFRHNQSQQEWEQFGQVACVGPVMCGVLLRGCGCGLPGQCCVRQRWLCPEL